ncbi:hypothetical protein KY312_04270 [Candidatus Woesearchaeota archaeon]|nr:hypothetical protein [Candidatus Woesearchaeota archaeon]
MKKIFTILVMLLLFSAATFAATCGNNQAEGNEECDGTDLRGFACRNVCRFNINNPQEFEQTTMQQWNFYPCLDRGSLACEPDCTFDASDCHMQICGDGILHFPEECDNGEQNSDSMPNRCRSNCRLPFCGDGVRDTGEECDEGAPPMYSGNRDDIPNRCREDCREPWCGDGVVDYIYGEECDDALPFPCNNCLRCYTPVDNLHISEDAALCPGTYEIGDTGEEGVIIVDGNDMTLDCNGAVLVGLGGMVAQGTQVSPGMQQIIDQEEEEEPPGFVGQVMGFIAGIFTGGGITGNPTNQATVIRSGTGIKITGSSVVLVGCDISEYRNGVKISGSYNALVNNRLCENSYDIRNEGQSNYGVKNQCDSWTDWQENGINGCTIDCGGTLREDGLQCPPCECPPCETTTTTIQPQQTTTTTIKTTQTTIKDEEKDELDKCIEYYMSKGFSYKEAEAICEGEAKPDDFKETTPTTVPKTEEPYDYDSCVKYFVELGYTKEYAIKICTEKYGPQTTTTIAPIKAPIQKIGYY